LGLVLEQMNKYEEAAQEFRKADDLRQKYYNRPFPEAEDALQALLTAHPEVDLETEKPSVPTSKSGQPVARVKVYFEDKGYGFLENKDQNRDYFFHITDVPGRETVSEGDYFVYDVEETEKGPRAVNLKMVSSS
jgi:cold shock CspA family protein